MAAPKAAALPLGDAPMARKAVGRSHTGLRRAMQCVTCGRGVAGGDELLRRQRGGPRGAQFRPGADPAGPAALNVDVSCMAGGQADQDVLRVDAAAERVTVRVDAAPAAFFTAEAIAATVGAVTTGTSFTARKCRMCSAHERVAVFGPRAEFHVGRRSDRLFSSRDALSSGMLWKKPVRTASRSSVSAGARGRCRRRSRGNTAGTRRACRVRRVRSWHPSG